MRRPSPRSTSRPSRRCDAIDDIAIIEELQDNSVKLVLVDGDDDGVSQLTWYLGGRSASLSQLLPMLQSMGVVVLEERPFTVVRPDGLAGVDLSVQDLAAPRLSRKPRRARHARPPPAVRRRGDRDLARSGRDRPVQRTGAARRADLAAGGRPARLREVLAAGRFSLQPVPHRDVHQRQRRTLRGRWSNCSRRCSTRSDEPTRRDAQAAAAAVAADIDALVSLDTDRVLRAFASMIQATLRTNYFVTRAGFGPTCRTCCRSSSIPD